MNSLALLISADATHIATVAKVVTALGGGLEVRASAQEAFELLRRSPPNVLLLDFGLPDGGALAVREFAVSAKLACTTALLAPPDLSPEWLLIYECDIEIETPIDSNGLAQVLADVLPVDTSDWTAQFHTDPSRVTLEKRRAGFAPLRTRPRMVYRVKPRTGLRAMSVPITSDSKPIATASGSAPAATCEEPALPETGAFATQGSTALERTGELALTPYSTILYRAFHRHLTGVLRLNSPPHCVDVYLLGGMPVAARGPHHRGVLIRQLVAMPGADSDAVRSLISASPSVNPATLLRSSGAVSPSAVDHVQRTVARSLLLEPFAWADGSYQLRETDRWPDDLTQFKFNPIRLIVDGIRAANSPNSLANDLDRVLDLFIIKTPKHEQFLRFFPANEAEWGWMEAMDGNTTLRQLTTRAQSQVMDLLTLVTALRAAGMVRFSPGPAEERTKAQ